MSARREKSKKHSGTKSGWPSEPITFFADRPLGLRAPERIREAAAFYGAKVELHKDHFLDDAPDEEWLVTVGEWGWVVLTKDKGIRHNIAERQAVEAVGVRLFTLGSGNLTGDDMAELFIKNLTKMARMVKRQPGAFIASVTKSGVNVLWPKEESE